MRVFQISIICFFIFIFPQIVFPSGNSKDSAKINIESVVRNSILSWETGDEEIFIATSHPDLLFAFPGERTDIKGALNVYRYWQTHYENTKVYINWVLVDGNRFAMEYQFASTRKSDSKRTAMGTVAIGRVEDGKIILLKEYTDGRASRLQEAGELPLEEGEEPFPWPRTNRTYPWHQQ